MYPIRKSRPIWNYPFLKRHICNELCNATYEITDNINGVSINHEMGCIYPEKIEPMTIPILHIDEYIFEMIERPIDIPKTVNVLIDFPLEKTFSKLVVFEDTPTISQILHVFKKLYEEIYEEEEKTSTIKTFHLKKECTDCKINFYDPNNITQYISKITQEIQCGICFETEDNELIRINKCNHIFHFNCIDRWYRTPNPQKNEDYSNSCPYCRQTIIFCQTCSGTKKIDYTFVGTVPPYESLFISEDITNRFQTDGTYGIHGFYIEELLFKGFVYNSFTNSIRLNPYDYYYDDDDNQQQ